MFTGIIRYKGIITNIVNSDSQIRVTLFSDIEEVLKLGDSVCVNGICLTIVQLGKNEYSFDVMSETIRKTTVSKWKNGDNVNIELSPTLSTLSLDGHIVSGHVDTIGTIIDIQDNVFFIQYPQELSPLILDKGSITVNGVSLTISACYHTIFTVSIIPLTMKWTTFGLYRIKDQVNLEGDLRLKKGNMWYNHSYLGSYVLSDEHGMEIALTIGEKGRYTTPPNPHVGCIITQNRKIVGIGYHTSPGNPHAEIEAFRSISSLTSNEELEMYVTLEPCCHVGRTGKCVDEIIKRGIKRVIIGVQDTDERVAGKGIQSLRDAGIQTVVLNSSSVRESVKEYLYQRKYGRPYVYLKMATTLDNKCAAGDKCSQWITCEESRLDGRMYRARVQCIITTSQTISNDNPQFTVRHPDYPNGKEPMVVVLNRSHREISLRPGWIEWYSSIEELFPYLVKTYNILSVLIECGPTFFNEMRDKQYYSEMILYMNTSTLGRQACSTFHSSEGENMKDKRNLGKLVECRQIQEDIKIVIRNPLTI